MTARHDHAPSCRAVTFDANGAYRGTCAFDIDQCATCAAEATHHDKETP